MDTQYILSVGSFIISFLACFFALIPYTGYKYSLKKVAFYKSSAYLPVYAFILIIFSVLYFINLFNKDFIHDIDFINIIVPLVAAGFIYGLSLLPRLKRFTGITIFVAALISVFFLPENFHLFGSNLPFWADRALIVILWWAYSYCYIFLNQMDGILPLQNMTFSLGLTLLGILGALPYLLTLFGIVLLALNLAFFLLNNYPAKISFSTEEAQSLGFIFGWLALISGAEECTPCILILSTYFIIEVITSFLHKMTLREEYKNLLLNTTYYQVNISGLSPDTIVRHLVKLEIIFVILSVFEIYAPNAYSVPLLAFIMGSWSLSRLRSWQTPEKSLKEINQELLDNIKNRLDSPSQKDK